MKIIRTAIALALFGLAVNMQAQQTRTATGSAMLVIPKNMTIEQAEVKVVEEAKNKIIADNFGTIVGSATTLTLSDRNGESHTSSFTFGDIEVKGEWLETTNGPHIERKVVNGEFVLEATISGRIREIQSAPIMYKASVLRNGVEDNCASDTFRHGDYMYVSFQSPEAGYLTIYITDGKDVQCLYPYPGLSAEYMKVPADKKYIFFSKEHCGDLDPMNVQRCKLGCSEDNEQNRIYLIFSPNKYSKAVDYYAEEDAPRHLSFEEFQNWLSKLKRLDKELTSQPFDITIRI